ncbi:MAG: Asd/ArgC dimerization domain-containing protein [Bryobacteraceae bacterium]|nr:Asd/ArgC dimerization domain-containing protein [Bryobacteraceae bacterium]
MVKVAIAGADTLLGRELRDLLNERPNVEIVPVDKSPLVLYAGRDVDEPKPDPEATVVDLTGTLPNGVLRAPMAEPERYLVPESLTISIAHPAAILLAMFFRRVAAVSPIRQAVVNVFEPVSQRGQAGLEELQQQTIALLNLRPLEQTVFDEQVAFNMLPRWGSDSAVKLRDVEARIGKEFAALYGPFDGLSMRLIQAPVFHGYVVSAWVSFDGEADPVALAKPFREVRSAEVAPPMNSGIAGESGMILDAIVPDGDRAAWFWVVADNLRLAAENALLAAASAIEQAARPVQ